MDFDTLARAVEAYHPNPDLDLLRRAYQRSVHRSYIEAALLRTGYAGLTKEPAKDPLPSTPKSD